MFKSIPSGAIAGTKPRMPMAIKTTPKRIASDLTILNLLLVLKGYAYDSRVASWQARKLPSLFPNFAVDRGNEKTTALSKIDNHEKNPGLCSALRCRRVFCRSWSKPGYASSHNQNRDFRRRLLLVHSTRIR